MGNGCILLVSDGEREAINPPCGGYYMKRIILTITAIIILSSCSMPAIDTTLDLKAAWRMAASFDYEKDPLLGYWKSPIEFETDGNGDCEDFATYLLYLLGPDSGARMAVIKVPNYSRLHAVVQLKDGTIIEPQIYGGTWGNGKPLWTLSYDTVMILAGNGSRALDIPQEMIDNGITLEMIAELE